MQSMKSIKGISTRKHIFERVKMQFVQWNYYDRTWPLLLRSTKGYPLLTGKNVGLLKRISYCVAEVDCRRELIFLHCITHQEVLCKKVLKMKHAVDPVVICINLKGKEFIYKRL